MLGAPVSAHRLYEILRSLTLQVCDSRRHSEGCAVTRQFGGFFAVKV